VACFDIKASFEDGFWILLAGMLALYACFFAMLFARSRLQRQARPADIANPVVTVNEGSMVTTVD
jgi:heme/copper-type cytochrome/quinol oxidase subunit 3